MSLFIEDDWLIIARERQVYLITLTIIHSFHLCLFALCKRLILKQFSYFFHIQKKMTCECITFTTFIYDLEVLNETQKAL